MGSMYLQCLLAAELIVLNTILIAFLFLKDIYFIEMLDFGSCSAIVVVAFANVRPAGDFCVGTRYTHKPSILDAFNRRVQKGDN